MTTRPFPPFTSREITSRRLRLLEIERERVSESVDAVTAGSNLGPADIAAIRRGVDDTLRIVAGTTLTQAAAAIAICDAIAPLLIRAPDPRAKAVGIGLRAACNLRRRIRGRT